MASKTHTTAVVLIPPEEICEPIQAIRRQRDRNYRRWMPHVTLLYPFRPREEFDDIAGPLEQACRTIEPFEVTLATFGSFCHGRRSFTLWLGPEPAERIRVLHEALVSAMPDCNDVRRFGGGFTPHLSVGQAKRRRSLDNLLASLQADWRPVRFIVGEVALIWRGQPPNDVFRIDRTIPLGC